jgi:hypothetical protein
MVRFVCKVVTYGVAFVAGCIFGMFFEPQDI